MLDWNQCPAVERVPGKVSGAWVFKGTRVPVKALFENLEDGARLDDFLAWFPGVRRDQAEAVLRHAENSLAAAWGLKPAPASCMKILFDQGTPAPLRDALTGHSVTTVYEQGWDQLANGDLLRVAEAAFDAFVTTDQNLRYQQNLTGRKLAILVLPTTSWPKLRAHTAKVSTAIAALRPGDYVELQI
jgi:uncharacterized protein (DUF433 family)